MKYKDRKADIGRFKQRVELQSYTTTSDGMGGTSAEWSTNNTIWADVKPVNGSDRFEIESLKGNITHTVRVRYTEANNEQRFLYNGRKLYIKYAINEGEEGAFTTLACTEEV